MSQVNDRSAFDPERGLSAANGEERVRRGLVNDVPTTPARTVGQIVRATVLTRYNASLGSMLVLILLAGQVRDALFGLVLVANSLIGVVQELRAKWPLAGL